KSLDSINNQQYDSNQISSKENILSEKEQTEDNDWNNQSSPLEFPLEESNLSIITQENLSKQMIDNETQTDDQQHDKLVQVNSKLKRALQTIKEKIHHIAIERPELFVDSTDDTIERLDHLIAAIGHQAAQIDLLKTEPIVSPSILLENEIKQLIEGRNQLQDDISNNNQEIHNLKCQIAEYEQELRELNEKYFEVLSNIEKQTQSSSRVDQLIDNETQTDDQQHDKLIQVNSKLKRALQTIKEKIHHVVIERPELFVDSADDTIERLDHLISVIEQQTVQMKILQTEHDHKQNEINDLQSSLESYRHKIQGNLSDKDQEKSLLEKRLNELELELKKTLNDHSSTMIKFESLAREHDVLVQQQKLQSIEHQQEIEELQDELIELKEIYIPSIDE
ncbi:unnamed protein product, partial [Rotaria sp. Silwood2]